MVSKREGTAAGFWTHVLNYYPLMAIIMPPLTARAVSGIHGEGAERRCVNESIAQCKRVYAGAYGDM